MDKRLFLKNGLTYRRNKSSFRKMCNNPNNVSAVDIQTLANEMNKDIGRYNPEMDHLYFDRSP